MNCVDEAHQDHWDLDWADLSCERSWNSMTKRIAVAKEPGLANATATSNEMEEFGTDVVPATMNLLSTSLK